ncbi:mid1-interacting protein 1-like [Erpetoichthys calabaricus]|uniref:MID1 interacting protein 1, like n=1 Tax=Erpetoichthys calabaricus TaxID=27687 RepID=A0A8C4SME6_ERPCA|nr:mid1-interacting protein 1-like [Erpetoichthys calabaricus]
MMQSTSEYVNPKHSLLDVMNKFIAATNNMDETVMVPTLLRDVPVEADGEECDSELNNNVGSAGTSKHRDMYERYLLLKSIRNDIEWGLLKREMNGGISLRELESREGEEGKDLESQLHYHLRGLFGVLSKLTIQANHLTTRYKQEIGGGSFTI